MGNQRWLQGDELTRRQVIRGLAYSALGVASFTGLPSLSSNAGAPFTFGRPRAKRLIFLYMAGGMSHVDTFDPKPGTDVAGPLGVIPTALDGVHFSELLPQTAAIAPHLAVVRSVTSTQGAHEQGRYFLRTSYQKRGTITHPSLGTWLIERGGRHHPTLPPSVVIGAGNDHPGAGFFGPQYAPLPLGTAEAGLSHIHHPEGVSAEQMQARLQLSRSLNARYRGRIHDDSPAVTAYQSMYDEALRLMGSRDLAAFDLNQEDAATRAAYGDHRFGAGCLLARRLCEHGVRSVEVTLGGWDMHNDVFDDLAERVPVLDQALSALINDLQQRGLLDETLVVLASEFGRTPKINKNAGRDHHPSVFSAVLAGGGIRGGQVYGRSDDRAMRVEESAVTVPDLNATIAAALGLDTTQITYSESGRPFSVADKGQPLWSLFS